MFAIKLLCSRTLYGGRDRCGRIFVALAVRSKINPELVHGPEWRLTLGDTSYLIVSKDVIAIGRIWIDHF